MGCQVQEMVMVMRCQLKAMGMGCQVRVKRRVKVMGWVMVWVGLASCSTAEPHSGVSGRHIGPAVAAWQ
jgi:hypothetical protein